MLVGEEGTKTASWRTITAVCLGVAIMVAWYVGFRLPNAWATTLQTVSVTDGFHRRIAIGTLLRPLAVATNYDYWLFATFSFLVLAGLIAALFIAALRSKSLGQRLLIVAFFLLPTGAYMFHIVGYFDQVLYLMLFVAIWLLGRGRIVAATVLMSLVPFVHEIAILSVLPVFGVVALRRTPLKTAVIITAIPTLVNAILLFVPIASDGAADTLRAALAQANFQYRPDAIAVFTRTQWETWKLYRIHEVVVYVRPVATFIVGAFAVLWWTNRKEWTPRPGLKPILMFVAAAAAIAMPALLVYAGWDHNRWIMLIASNFMLVAWILLEDSPLSNHACAVLVTTLLVIGHVKIDYFTPDAPRTLTYRDVRWFLRELRSGEFFVTPSI